MALHGEFSAVIDRGHSPGICHRDVHPAAGSISVVPDNKAVMLEFAGASLEYTADDLIDKQKQVAMLLSQRVRGQVWFR